MLDEILFSALSKNERVRDVVLGELTQDEALATAAALDSPAVVPDSAAPSNRSLTKVRRCWTTIEPMLCPRRRIGT